MPPSRSRVRAVLPAGGLGGTRSHRNSDQPDGCAVEALGKAGARPRDVAAIGITNQRETVIVWERETGKPIHPAIVWQDRRTAALCEALEKSGVGEEVSVEDRPGDRSVFFRDQGEMDSGQRAGRARAGGTRRAGVWHRGQLADLAPDQRQAARHGRDQCLAHAALQHRERRVGCGVAAHLRRSGEPVAGGGVVERARRRSDNDAGPGRRRPSRASPATSRRRCLASCAGARAKRRTPTAPAAFCCRTSARSSCARSTG